MAKKTACEEVANILEHDGSHLTALDLRAEGQELSRLRKIIERVSAIPGWQHPVWKQIEREAVRIQKARTKK